MAKLEEIIKTEMSRSDSRTFSKIHLFKEGAFLRAYEQSAWLMSRHAAAELTPKRHKTKQTADGTFVFVGFPLTSLDKYRPVNSQDVPSDESRIILDLPADTFPEEVTKELYDADFERWKKEMEKFVPVATGVKETDDLLVEIYPPIEDQSSKIIKVIGVGGGGSNAVKNMYNTTPQGVRFAVCNTDSQALHNCNVPVRIMLGKDFSFWILKS